MSEEKKEAMVYRCSECDDPCVVFVYGVVACDPYACHYGNNPHWKQVAATAELCQAVHEKS